MLPSFVCAHQCVAANQETPFLSLSLFHDEPCKAQIDINPDVSCIIESFEIYICQSCVKWCLVLLRVVGGSCLHSRARPPGVQHGPVSGTQGKPEEPGDDPPTLNQRKDDRIKHRSQQTETRKQIAFKLHFICWIIRHLNMCKDAIISLVLRRRCFVFIGFTARSFSFH